MALLIPSSIPERWTEIYESAKALLEGIGLVARNWNAYAHPPQPAKSIETFPDPSVL